MQLHCKMPGSKFPIGASLLHVPEINYVPYDQDFTYVSVVQMTDLVTDAYRHTIMSGFSVPYRLALGHLQSFQQTTVPCACSLQHRFCLVHTHTNLQHMSASHTHNILGGLLLAGLVRCLQDSIAPHFHAKDTNKKSAAQHPLQLQQTCFSKFTKVQASY